MDAAVSLNELAVAYGSAQRPQVSVSHFQLEPARLAVLSGTSGCGKTTLLRTLKGLIPHYRSAYVRGHLQVAGRDPRLDPAFAADPDVAYLFQVPETQMFNLTVEDELTFGMHVLGYSEAERRQALRRAVDHLQIGDLLTKPVQHLSSGQKQRVALASLLMMQPKVVLLDEPYAFLDAEGAASLTEWLMDSVGGDFGAAALIVEHRLRLLSSMDAPMYVMEEGDIKPLGGTSSADSFPPPPAHPAPGSPVVEVKQVSFSYGGRDVLTDVDLTLHEGEWTALMGPNGCGKSTLAKLLVGQLRPRKGRIERRCKRYGVMYPNPYAQCLMQDVRSELLYPLTAAEDGGRGIRGRWRRRREADVGAGERRALAIAESLGIDGKLGTSPYLLSVGQAARVVLGANVMVPPDLLVLDEPTAGLDMANTIRLIQLIRREMARASVNPAVLVITHDEGLARWACRRTVKMEGGRIVGEETSRQMVA